jgi:poly(3-hydroxyalkanoate) synthetase
MEWRSPFVQGLAASLQKRADLPLYHIATRTDQLIIPYSSALLNPDPAHQCIVEDVGHASLLFSPRVTAQIKTWLQALRSV